MVNSSPKTDARLGDRAIAALALRQHGVVSRRQLRELGVDDNAVAYRVRTGRLHRLHRGVYAVGHAAVGVRGRWMAATLTCGPGAALSHASAGALWELRSSAAARTDVTVPNAAGRTDARLRVHRTSTLYAGEVTTRHGIPATTPARTILDLAAGLQRRPLERLLDQAENLRLADRPSLEALARAHPGHRGARELERVLQAHIAGSTITRSELEERFLELCREVGFPRPRVNVHVAGLEVDFLFEAADLIVETDGYRYHRTRDQFERDRQRDALLAQAGYRTLRFTHRQVTSEPATVMHALEVAYRGASAASSVA
jgi:very-short-patch-repair endonuclease